MSFPRKRESRFKTDPRLRGDDVGRFLSLWLPVVLYTALIFWISSAYRPIPGIEVFPQMDKLCHVAEYLPLGVLLIRAFQNSFPIRWPFTLAAAFAAALLIGAADELYQSFIPMKEMSGLDLAADAAGAALGLRVYRWRAVRRRGQVPFDP